jgi:hypothetical protein
MRGEYRYVSIVDLQGLRFLNVEVFAGLHLWPLSIVVDASVVLGGAR